MRTLQSLPQKIQTLLPEPLGQKDMLHARRKQAHAFILHHSLPKQLFIPLSFFLDISKKEKRPANVTVESKNRLIPLLWSEMDREQREFVIHHAFSTFQENNYLHQLYIAFSPTVFLLDLPKLPADTILTIVPTGNTHTIIHIRDCSRVTIIEKRHEMEKNTLSAVEIFQNGGEIHYSSIQEKKIQNHIFLRHAFVENKGILQWYPHIFGGDKTYNEIKTECHNSASHIQGTFVSSNQEKLYMDYAISHAQGEGRTSNITVHGVSKDHSYSSFQGNISIHQKAKNIVADLHEHCLLFSPHAKHDTMPTLQIHTKDSSAKHNTSISHIDNNQLFYMMSRGMTYQETKNMIAASSLEQTIQYIPSTPIREQALHLTHQFFRYV